MTRPPQVSYFLPGALGLASAVALFLFCATPAMAAGEVKKEVRFYDDIKPVFSTRCYHCHGPDAAKGGLRLDRREAALAKGDSGSPAVVPGDAAHSELVRRITSHDPDEVMPRKGERLSAAEVEVIRRWIEQGARWPEKDDYWAFQPPQAPPVPGPVLTGNAPRESSNPIDRFIDARLAAAKVAPAPPADPRTLLRRAYADLLGVPPSPAEAEAFLNDPSPDAWEKLIDRLLADPRYGQRWARHWLDLVRYGESDGFEDDKIRPHAWRYRDYVIRSLNADKPYDRFVREQIAGDELWPSDPNAWVATGFARLGAWDGMSKDPPRQRQDFLNDVTDATGSVFLGLTVGCARCHDHKYDAITQRDYYALQAFFTNVTRGTHDSSASAADLHDPPHVTEALAKARAELARLHGERQAILQEARSTIEWEHRCEADENGQLPAGLVTDEKVKQRANRLHPGRLGAIDAEAKPWERIEQLNAPAADAVYETTSAAPKTLLLKGGELSRPGAEVAPAFIEAMTAAAGTAAISPPPGIPGTGRRTALANWLASPVNPLTARVIVNRLWQHHFGRGLVATPSDFGRHGKPPTHPELLDWLARRLVADGWSLKRMHRLMMTSDAYRRSSAFDPAAAATDPENELLWRMNRQRLEAEAIRDSILAASGQLSPVAGGPGVYPPLPKGVNVELPNNDKELSWGACSDEEGRRRTVYVFQRRSLTFPLVDVFDGAAMSQTCPARAQTTVSPQALALLNGDFCRDAARRLAERVRREAGDEMDARIRRAFLLTLIRQPSDNELAATRAFLAKQAGVRRGIDANLTPAAASAAAFDDFCHVLLNANEFVFVD